MVARHRAVEPACWSPAPADRPQSRSCRPSRRPAPSCGPSTSIPTRPGSTWCRPSARALVPRGDAPGLRRHRGRRCAGGWEIDVLVPTVDIELLPVVRRAAEFADARHDRAGSVGRHARDAASTSGPSSHRCPASPSCPRPRCSTTTSTPKRGRGPSIAKPRQGSGRRGVTLVAGPADLRRRGRATARTSCSSYLPGRRALARRARLPRRHRCAAVVPRTPPQGRLGHRGRRLHVEADAALVELRPPHRRGDRPDVAWPTCR